MSFERLEVNLPYETLSAIKKRAFSEGKSKSAIARELIETGLENRSSGGGAGTGSDPVEAFKRAIRELRKEGEGEEDYRVVLADLGLESLKTTPGPDGLSPSIVRYLVETQARIDSILQKVLNFAEMPGVTPGEREDWLGVAGRNAKEILNSLNLGGEN